MPLYALVDCHWNGRSYSAGDPIDTTGMSQRTLRLLVDSIPVYGTSPNVLPLTGGALTGPLSMSGHQITDVADSTTPAGLTTLEQVNALIASAISSLLGGATPTALDTLYKIAAALNDDSNLAADLIASIATKATAAALTTETTRATNAEGTIASAVSAETTRAEAAEAVAVGFSLALGMAF